MTAQTSTEDKKSRPKTKGNHSSAVRASVKTIPFVQEHQSALILNSPPSQRERTPTHFTSSTALTLLL